MFYLSFLEIFLNENQFDDLKKPIETSKQHPWCWRKFSSNFSLMTLGLLKCSLTTEAGMILLMVQKFPAPDVVDIDILAIHRGFSTIPDGCVGFLNHQRYHGTLQLPNVRFRIRLDCLGS